jgi:hypothetical protein
VKTISLKLPVGLHAKLDRAARQSKQSKSQVVRAALEHFLTREQRSPSKRPVSALELAGDLVGCVAGPGDLSMTPSDFEGFGK